MRRSRHGPSKTRGPVGRRRCRRGPSETRGHAEESRRRRRRPSENLRSLGDVDADRVRLEVTRRSRPGPSKTRGRVGRRRCRRGPSETRLMARASRGVLPPRSVVLWGRGGRCRSAGIGTCCCARRFAQPGGSSGVPRQTSGTEGLEELVEVGGELRWRCRPSPVAGRERHRPVGDALLHEGLAGHPRALVGLRREGLGKGDPSSGRPAFLRLARSSRIFAWPSSSMPRMSAESLIMVVVGAAPRSRRGAREKRRYDAHLEVAERK
jgi:hypothetical protein